MGEVFLYLQQVARPHDRMKTVMLTSCSPPGLADVDQYKENDLVCCWADWDKGVGVLLSSSSFHVIEAEWKLE